MAFCKKHPTSFIGKDQWGHWYIECVQGHKLKEKCEIELTKEEQQEEIDLDNQAWLAQVDRR